MGKRNWRRFESNCRIVWLYDLSNILMKNLLHRWPDHKAQLRTEFDGTLHQVTRPESPGNHKIWARNWRTSSWHWMELFQFNLLGTVSTGQREEKSSKGIMRVRLAVDEWSEIVVGLNSTTHFSIDNLRWQWSATNALSIKRIFIKL